MRAIIEAKNSYKSNMTGRKCHWFVKRKIMAMAHLYERHLLYWIAVIPC